MLRFQIRHAAGTPTTMLSASRNFLMWSYVRVVLEQMLGYSYILASHLEKIVTGCKQFSIQ